MTTLPIDVQGINPAIVQLGVIVGLLQQANSNYSIDLDWFKNPLPSLKNIPTERANFLTLFRDLLGNAGDSPPGDKRKWYPITQKGKSTNCYVVLPADDTGTSSIIGLGMMHSYTESSITITPYLYVPLFELPITGNPIITGQTKDQTNYPIEIGLDLKDTQERFKSGNVSFDGLQFAGDVLFAGTGSSFNVNFLDLQPPGTKGTYSTIQDLLNSLPNVGSPKDWINAVLESQTVTGWLNQKIGSSNETPGLLLTALGLLQQPSQQSTQQYILGDLSKFTSESPKTILESFFFTVLSKLASNDKPLISLSGEGNGIYVVGESEGSGSNAPTDYGLRLQIADIDATSSSENGKSSSEEDNNANSPQIKLQLGQWLTGEDKNSDSWLNRAAPKLTTPDPGLALYLIQADNNIPSFHPKLELVSLGLSFQGSNDKPLVDTKGVTLGGIEPRIYLSIDFENPTPIPWGAAIRCDKLGLPLGSGLNSASSNNPVAQNLLDSGSDDENENKQDEDKQDEDKQDEDKQDEDKQDEDKQAVNPTFSAALAYSTVVNFQLYDSDGKAADTVWLPIQRAFGPLHCQKIGVGWQDAAKLLSFLYYGGVSLAGLDVELEGLSVAIPVTTPADLSSYQFALQGLDITLDTGPVEISGGLQETFDNNVPVYNGEALIKAGEFSISALGSYTTLDGNPSMFIFAFIDDPIGGPPPCFITGLCGGFGYNRGLTIPTVDQIQTFPFVAGLTDPDQVGGKDATPADALAKIANLVPPTRGEDWLAIGLQFTSFELIQSHALLTVEFGKEFEIALLGLSTIKLPAEGTETFAYVEMELEVVLKPQEGEFSAIAVLTPNSFVLDRDCHLTGGFAFCLWFGNNPHAGDFVLTIGGYHPQFDKTSKPWYPTVPRLGFNWTVDDAVTISGQAYFALTPSCVMGGGRLEALYQSGQFRAWFIAHADFLIAWKPFSYSVSIGIDIGASYTFWLFGTVTLKFELGANLDLWGPPTGGTVSVYVYIVTITVSFGPTYTSPPAIDWTAFQALLPHSKATQSFLIEDDPNPDLSVCHIVVSKGLDKTVSDTWCIRADEFVFSIDTAVPLTEIDLVGPNQQTTPLKPTDPNYFVGIRPMGISSLTSTAQIQITKSSNSNDYQDLNADWNWVVNQHDVPEAMWGKPSDGPPLPAANLLKNRWVGLQQIQITPAALSTPIVVDAASAFEYAIIDDNNGIPDYLPVSATTAPINQPPQISEQAINTISQTLTSDVVKAKRTSLFNALANIGVNAGADGDLTADQQNVGLNYQASPMIGTPDGITT